MSCLNRVALRFIALFLISALLLSSGSALVASTEAQLPTKRAFVDPALLDPLTYSQPFLIEAPEEYLEAHYQVMQFALSQAERLREGQVKIVITAARSVDLKALAERVRGVISVMELPAFLYIEAWATREDVEALSRLPGIYSVAAYRVPLSTVIATRELVSRAEAEPLEPLASEEPATHKAVEVIGAVRVHREYNATGRGVVVAVVDTGVDFGSPGLGPASIARTAEGVPLIFDSDQAGLVLTLASSTRTPEGLITLPREGVIYFDGYFYALGRTTSMFLQYISPAGRSVVLTVPLTTYRVGDIPSASGIYRFGLAVQYHSVSGFGTLYVSVPVLYVDSAVAGRYDTVYADLSTLYYLLLRAMNLTGVIRAPPDSAVRPLFDLSFADERPARYGSEVLARDFTGDGVPDVSIGALAGFLYDFLGVLTGEAGSYSWLTGWDYTGRILPGMDPRGTYVTIAYDYNGHGSSVANTIAARLDRPVSLAYGRYPLRGIAPDALIAANTGLVNPIAAVIFFSGFDLVRVESAPYGIWFWSFTGRHKADIISNSWGSSVMLLFGFATGVTNYAQLWDYLIARSGTIIVHAGGNGGPGYGTITSPGDSAFAITAGASTLFEYRPAFGFLPGTYHDVVSWSLRGPTNIGTVKPDVVNIGSFEWAFTHTLAGLGDGMRAFTLFSGTSQATPMTSGAIALLLSYMKARGMSYSPGFVKCLLKSTAVDMGYNAYSQGSGHVDIYRTVTAVARGGIPMACSPSLAVAMRDYHIAFPADLYGGPTALAVGDVQLYPGAMKPGSAKELDLSFRVFGSESVRVNLSAVTFLVSSEGLVRHLNLTAGYAIVGGRAVPLRDLLVRHTDDSITIRLVSGLSRIFIPVYHRSFEGVQLAEIVAYVPYSVFDPLGRRGSYSPALRLGIELHYGIDVSNDRFIDPGETQRINYDIRDANVLHMKVGRPIEKFKMAEEIAARFLGRSVAPLLKSPMFDLRFFSISPAYIGREVTIKLEFRKHERAPWTWISVPSSISVRPGEVAGVKVRISVPADASPGLYEGYVIARYSGGETLIPVSVPVAIVIGRGTESVTLMGEQRFSYNNYAVSGQFDWAWRYESADWRSFPVLVEDPSVIGYLLTVSWKGVNTNIDVAAAGLSLPALTVALTGPPEELFYGAVYAAKLNFPPFWPRHGIQAFYDSPIPKSTTIFVPAYVQPMGFAGLPEWIIIKNVYAEASSEAGFPEPFQVFVKPVRKAGPEVVNVRRGESAEVAVRVHGSHALSFGSVLAAMVYDDGRIDFFSVTPSRLGFGSDFTLRATVRPSASGYLFFLVILHLPSIDIGYVLRDAKTVFYREQAIVFVPVEVRVS
ncbi:MAG: S8 family serine peptidase [Acidilobaceae archaeon]|nr:S8 family serine peptidase [Acidilobaceae archaeon]